jgi:peptide/nickel transport system permease protein
MSRSLGVTPSDAPVEPAGRPGALRRFVRAVTGTTAGCVGSVLLLLVVLVAVLGPLVAPHDVGAIVGPPQAGPSGAAPFGTDMLGRDTLSRFLLGGWILLVVALTATVAAYLIGGTLGMLVGYRRGIGDLALVAGADVLIAIPAIVFALALVAGLGDGVAVIALAVAIVQTPPAFRLVRSFTIVVATSEYVEASVAQGESSLSILWRDILPNIRVPVLADFGIRMSWSIMLFASLSFLGLGQAPPAADWGLMISENRGGLLTQPLPVIVPAAGIALLTISVSLVADAFARAAGRSSGGSHA